MSVMDTASGASAHAQGPACWCCGNPFEETDLTRLGAHPEVGVCAGCAQWVNRRARSTSDNGLHSPAVVLRRGIDGVRERAINAGAHHWPLVGPLLTRAYLLHALAGGPGLSNTGGSGGNPNWVR